MTAHRLWCWPAFTQHWMNIWCLLGTDDIAIYPRYQAILHLIKCGHYIMSVPQGAAPASVRRLIGRWRESRPSAGAKWSRLVAMTIMTTHDRDDDKECDRGGSVTIVIAVITHPRRHRHHKHAIGVSAWQQLLLPSDIRALTHVSSAKHPRLPRDSISLWSRIPRPQASYSCTS